MNDIDDLDFGKTILEEVRDKKYPSLRRTAHGYALVLLYNMADAESDASLLRAVPRIIDGLIDFDMTDEAMGFFVKLCDQYNVTLAPAFVQYAVIGPLAKSFVIEFYIAFRDLMETLEPALRAAGL